MPRPSSILSVLLLGECQRAVGQFAFSSSGYYYSDLPAQGTSTCCGSNLVGDPNLEGFTSRDRLCDVTAGACDSGCCCDPDCSFDSLRQGGIFGCTSNGTAVAPTGYTLCSDQLLSANVPESMQQQGLVTSFGGADGLLCVVSDNSPARGAFFRDPVATAALTAPQVLVQIQTALPIQYGTWLGPASAVAPAFYATGAPVVADAGGARASVLMPAAGPDGTCTGQQSLPYLHDIDPFSCGVLPPSASASASTMEMLCGTTLNASYLASASFASSPAASAASAPFGLYVDTSNSSDVFTAAAASDAPVSVFDAAKGECLNALQLYQLRLTVSGQGTLAAADAFLSVGTVDLASLSTARMTYGAAFVYADRAESVRPTSGRPGYIRGKPLLVAEATALRVGGMRVLPRSPKGECASGHAGATTVLYGEDLAVSCSKTYTPAELEQACLYPPALADQPQIAALNITAATVIGIYGDSHPNTPEDWVPLTLRYPQNDARQIIPSWDPSAGECTNMLSGMDFKVLTTNVGSTTTPISKVVGAELHFRSRSVRATRCARGGTCGATTVTVTATTTYASLDSESYAFIPESPQLIAPLPYDFFYPFYMSSNPAR